MLEGRSDEGVRVWGSRVLWSSAAALALVSAAVIPAAASPDRDYHNCTDLQNVQSGQTVDCYYNGVRAKVRVLDHDCIVLVRVVAGEHERRVVGEVQDQTGRRGSVADVGIHIGDCYHRRPVTTTPPATATPVPPVTDVPAPVQEAPAPDVVETHLPVTH